MKRCSCGIEVNSKQEWFLHYMIGKPSVPIKSRFTKITDEQIVSARLRLEDYKRKHVYVENCRCLKK